MFLFCLDRISRYDSKTDRTFDIHTVFRTIYKMDHNKRTESGEQYAKRRPEELTAKYKK